MRRTLVLLVVVTAAAVAALAPPEAVASGCERLSLTGQSSLNPANGKVEGMFEGTLGGRPVAIHSSTTIVGQQQLGTALLLSTAHTFTLPDGSKVGTVDRALLLPTATPGVYHAFSRLEVVSGGSGWILGLGTIDLRQGVDANWRWVEGRICGA
jgi:hypothetical protein